MRLFLLPLTTLFILTAEAADSVDLFVQPATMFDRADSGARGLPLTKTITFDVEALKAEDTSDAEERSRAWSPESTRFKEYYIHECRRQFWQEFGDEWVMEKDYFDVRGKPTHRFVNPDGSLQNRPPEGVRRQSDGPLYVTLRCRVQAYKRDNYVGNVTFVIHELLDNRCLDAEGDEGRFLLRVTYDGQGRLRMGFKGEAHRNKFIGVSEKAADGTIVSGTIIPPVDNDEAALQFNPETREARLTFYYVSRAPEAINWEALDLSSYAKGALVIPFTEQGQIAFDRLYLEIFETTLPLSLVSRRERLRVQAFLLTQQYGVLPIRGETIPTSSSATGGQTQTFQRSWFNDGWVTETELCRYTPPFELGEEDFTLQTGFITRIPMNPSQRDEELYQRQITVAKSLRGADRKEKRVLQLSNQIRTIASVRNPETTLILLMDLLLDDRESVPRLVRLHMSQHKVALEGVDVQELLANGSEHEEPIIREATARVFAALKEPDTRTKISEAFKYATGNDYLEKLTIDSEATAPKDE